MIEINNLTTGSVDDDFLRKTAKIVLKGEKKEKLELSVAIVGSGRIKTLNKKYRKKNSPTDVLSFSYNGSGDIVICLKEVKKNAKKFGFPLKTELARVLIHGILHFLKYSHEISEEKTKIMERKQRRYLSQI